MKGKILFVVSLLIILLFSWINADFFGNSHIKYFSEYTKQIIHFAFLAITCFIGYINWRGKDKWIQWLWGILYAAVFVFVAISIGAIYLTVGNPVFLPIKTIVMSVRNTFTGPLPFLTFYLFIAIFRNLSSIIGADKKA